jgi:prepilin-type N-terminal cleavage/methylation domain-containing protein
MVHFRVGKNTKKHLELIDISKYLPWHASCHGDRLGKNSITWRSTGLSKTLVNIQVNNMSPIIKKGGFTMSPLSGRDADLHYGFTLVELMVALSILAVLCSIAIPAYSSWLPDYELKNAVRDLRSNMYLTKMLSIRRNAKYQIAFNTAGKGSYSILKPDGTVDRTVSFERYDKRGGIRYGGGNATEDAKGAGDPVPGDGVSYQYNKTSFNSKGIGSWGYVYLANKKGTAFAVGSRVTGIIVVKKWNKAKGEWL